MNELPHIAPGYGPDAAAEPAEDVSGCLANRCVIDKRTLREAMDAAMGTLRGLRIAELVLMLLCLGLLLWSLIGHLGIRPLIWAGFALALLLYCYWQQFIHYPKRAVRNQLTRQALEDGTVAMENRLYFKAENVANRRGEAEELLHMPYENIKRVIEARRLIVIATRKKNLIPLDKAGFENGSPEDFWRLLGEKAPKAKLLRQQNKTVGS